jgi:DNA-packaging protein gp3
MGQELTADSEDRLDQLAKLTPKQLKRTLGRPTKYHSGLLPKAIEYLRTYKDRGEIVPSRAGLGKALGISRNTVTDWAGDEDKYEFSCIVHALDMQQELDGLNGGLSGELHPKIVALLLSRHGYSEGSQGGSGVSITVNVDRGCDSVVIEGEKVGD